MIKNCPCGYPAGEPIWNGKSGNSCLWTLSCNNYCGFHVHATTKKEVIRIWNTRVSPWIKCEKRLPKPQNMEDSTSEYMNIHYAGLYQDTYTYGYYIFETGKWYDSAGMKISNVIAWMPIPEFRGE